MTCSAAADGLLLQGLRPRHRVRTRIRAAARSSAAARRRTRASRQGFSRPACARVTGQPKSSQLPGCDANRVRTSACACCVITSGAKRLGGGTAPGPLRPKLSRLSASKFHCPPSGFVGAPRLGGAGHRAGQGDGRAGGARGGGAQHRHRLRAGVPRGQGHRGAVAHGAGERHGACATGTQSTVAAAELVPGDVVAARLGRPGAGRPAADRSAQPPGRRGGADRRVGAGREAARGGRRATPARATAPAWPSAARSSPTAPAPRWWSAHRRGAPSSAASRSC